MIDPEQINLLIREGEGLTVEFKERFTPRIDEDMVAFANSKGGVILLGVRDNRAVTGEQLTNDLKARINSVARNCTPPITVTIREAGKVVVVEVLPGEERPYSCASGYFRRLDGATQKMSNQELRVMFREHDPVPFEERIHPAITWEDIAKAKVRAFQKEAHISAGRAAARDVLTSLNVAGPNGITNAGVLFFAKDPRRFILQAQMTMIAFKGTDRVHIFDRQDVQGDLLSQFTAAEFFLKKHLNRRSVIKGMNREDIYEIPLEALREGLVNAIIHRDYSIRGTSLMVEIYDDRIEITNPGGIPKGLDKKNFGRISVRRNELIADLFHRMDKGERAGTGIRRMNEAMKAADLPLPICDYGTFYTITFKRPTRDSEATNAKGTQQRGSVSMPSAAKTRSVSRSESGLESGLGSGLESETSNKVLVALAENPMSRSALAEVLGYKRISGALNRAIKELLSKGLVEYTIPNKPNSRLQKYRRTA